MIEVSLELQDERTGVLAIYVDPHPRTGGKWRVGYIMPGGKACLFPKVGTKSGKGGKPQHGLEPSQVDLVAELAERDAADEEKLKQIMATDATRQLEEVRADGSDS